MMDMPQMPLLKNLQYHYNQAAYTANMYQDDIPDIFQEHLSDNEASHSFPYWIYITLHANMLKCLCNH